MKTRAVFSSASGSLFFLLSTASTPSIRIDARLGPAVSSRAFPSIALLISDFFGTVACPGVVNADGLLLASTSFEVAGCPAGRLPGTERDFGCAGGTDPGWLVVADEADGVSRRAANVPVGFVMLGTLAGRSA